MDGTETSNIERLDLHPVVDSLQTPNQKDRKDPQILSAPFAMIGIEFVQLGSCY